jgi:hypothetical protein
MLSAAAYAAPIDTAQVVAEAAVPTAQVAADSAAVVPVEIAEGVLSVGAKEYPMELKSQTRNDDTHHIETWHDEQRVGKKQTIAAEWHHIRVVHNKLNEQERKHETQRETARIAHKNLVFMFLSTIDIVI